MWRFSWEIYKKWGLIFVFFFTIFNCFSRFFDPFLTFLKTLKKISHENAHMPKKGSKRLKKPPKLHDQKVKCKNCRSGDNKKLDGIWGVGERDALGWGGRKQGPKNPL